MRYLLSHLLRIGWVEQLFRQRTLPFRKYQVAPRQGARALQRRLLTRLRGGDGAFPVNFEPTTEF